MAQPPPSGPSQPPYQPYPQQPYPPQYPPQQPYYAPGAPPPKEDHTLLYVAVAIIVVIVVIAVLALYFFFIAVNTAGQFTKVTITGVSFTVQYNGANSGYFGTQVTSCPTCPFTVSVIGPFTYKLTLHNSGAFDQSVDTITLSTSGYFQLTGVSPTLPATVTGASSLDFTLTIQATSPGTYTLAGTIGTS